MRASSGVILASPVYNYTLSSALKNFIELVGRGFENKAVGMMAAAGGERSFMAPLGLANGLMLDFRAVIVPRFVYATEGAFQGEAIVDELLIKRVEQLVGITSRLGRALTEQLHEEVLWVA